MKRFTATEKWDKAWFRQLPTRIKCLWVWLCDRCDSCGAIDFDADLASFQIGEGVTEKDFQFFGDRIEKLSNGKWWICGFIKFQYRTLSRKSEFHKNIFKFLDQNKIGLDEVWDVEGDTGNPPITPPATPPTTPPLTPPNTHKDQDQDQDKGSGSGSKNPNLVAAAAECDRLFAQYSKLPLEIGHYDRIWFDLLNRRFLPADVEVYLRWVIHENGQREESKYKTRFHVPKMFGDLERFAADVQLAKAWSRNLVRHEGFCPGGDGRTAKQILPAVIAQIPKPQPNK